MEKFLPILNTLQVRLREILIKSKSGMLSWNIIEIRHVGDELLKLSSEVCSQLAQVEHRILYQSIREAGLNIKMRTIMIEEEGLKEEDKEYFENVYETLSNICEKIESGEYYRALVDVARKRAKERQGNLL